MKRKCDATHEHQARTDGRGKAGGKIPRGAMQRHMPGHRDAQHGEAHRD